MRWILICVGFLDAVLANYTFTYEMASRCKEHICQHGYKYETYYRVDSDLRQPSSKAGVALELHLAILAASNGHILLSTVPQPVVTDPVYEIVVGGGGNKFTELRRNLRRNSKSTAKTLGILSPIQYRAFYIKIEDGEITFGREGDLVPLLSYFDTDPVDVKYFSFTAWSGVEAKFLYDCPVAGENGTNHLPDSEAVETKLPISEQLKKSLLQDRSVHLAPGSIVPVKFGAKLTGVRYDAFESKIFTQFAAVVSWTDDSMAWNPSKFNGTTNLLFRPGQIWTPTFLIANSADIGMLEPRNADLISMVYSGEATFHFQAKATSWCMDPFGYLNKWPRDEYLCTVVMSPWNMHETIKLEYLGPTTTKMKIFTDIDTILKSQWEVVYGHQGVITSDMWNKALTINEDNSTVKSDKYVFSIKLRRRAMSYNLVFYTPLFVLLTFLLLSFWTESLKMTRVWFYAGSAIFVCMGLSYIDILVPCYNIPSILVLYTCLLMAILLALFINILMMTPMLPPFYKNRLMQYLLMSKLFRMIFCLTALKTSNTYESVNQGFLAQEDDDSGVEAASRSGPVEEMQTENHSVGEREECAEVIDKIMFTVYSIVFAVMLACHF